MFERVKVAASAIGGLAIGLGVLAGDASAATVTHGFLTSDDATDIIVDSANNREYTRLDAFSLTYAQTVAAIGSGGAYEGWSIMTSDTIDQFVASLLGLVSSPCDGAVSYGATCGTVAGWADAVFGNSYTSTFDYIAFLNTHGGNEIGLIEILFDGQVREYENWSNTSTLDAYPNINLMLYRDVTAVPVPAALPLLAAGLGVMGFVGRRKRSRAQA